MILCGFFVLWILCGFCESVWILWIVDSVLILCGFCVDSVDSEFCVDSVDRSFCVDSLWILLVLCVFGGFDFMWILWVVDSVCVCVLRGFCRFCVVSTGCGFFDYVD